MFRAEECLKFKNVSLKRNTIRSHVSFQATEKFLAHVIIVSGSEDISQTEAYIAFLIKVYSSLISSDASNVMTSVVSDTVFFPTNSSSIMGTKKV